jgi:hypothetical protein
MPGKFCPYCGEWLPWGGVSLHVKLKHPDKKDEVIG